jgi:hypothetical protein
VRFNWSCTCGDRWYGDVPQQTLYLLRAEWERGHSKEGHATCSAGFAGRVKRKNKEAKAKQ